MAFALARFNSKLAAAGDTGKKHIGKVARRGLEVGVHAVTALASKNMPDGIFGVAPLKPDWVVAIGAGIATLVARGKLQDTSRSAMWGGVHALITRWVSTTHVFATSGPDGVRFGTQPPSKQPSAG